MRFKDKVIPVSGGASGIGAAIVEAFASQGGAVTFSDISEEAGSRAETALRLLEYDVTFRKCYATVESEVADLGAYAARSGTLDIAINNVGGVVRPIT